MLLLYASHEVHITKFTALEAAMQGVTLHILPLYPAPECFCHSQREASGPLNSCCLMLAPPFRNLASINFLSLWFPVWIFHMR